MSKPITKEFLSPIERDKHQEFIDQLKAMGKKELLERAIDLFEDLEVVKRQYQIHLGHTANLKARLDMYETRGD